MTTIPVIIDCDPGQDDAVALMVALASPELEVLGITVVYGNVPLARTAANARSVVEFAGRPEIPVFAGSDRPLQRPARHAVRVHGVTGLRGWDPPEPQRPVEQRHAVEFLVDTLRARDDVTLCALGPLTNLAAAFAWAPEIVRRVRRIVLMGGGTMGGNITPVAEFNIHSDPEAAAAVFAAGAPVVMIGLNLTWQALTTPERLAACHARGGRAGQVAAAMYDYPERYDFGRYGGAGPAAARPVRDRLCPAARAVRRP